MLISFNTTSASNRTGASSLPNTINLTGALSPINVTRHDSCGELNEEFKHSNHIGLLDKVFLWPVAVLICFESILLLAVFVKNSSLRKAANVVVISLVFSDFLNGIVLLPCVLLVDLDHPVVNTTMMLVLISSFGNVFGCAFDRFVAVRYALSYRRIMQKWFCIKMVVLVWLTAIILAIIPKCIGAKYERSFSFRRVYLGVILSFLFFLTILIFMAYGYIFRTVLAHIRKISELNNLTKCRYQKSLLYKLRVDLRHTRMFALTAANFLACWFPLIYINFVADVLLQPELAPPTLLKICLYTIFLSSLVNPIIYAYCKTDVRNEVFKILKWRLKNEDFQTITTRGKNALKPQKEPSEESWYELFKEQCTKQQKILLFNL